MVTGIIIAAAVVGILGILIGVFLGIASEKFKVEVDEKEILVRNELPGNNCGGCGYAGCDALAKAIAAGQADVGACPVGGASTAEKIGAIMGVAGGAAEKKVAFVKCKGSCDKTAVQYNYYGVDDCKKVSVVPGAGEKACAYGCMGYGSCVRACAFDAIHVVDGVAVVDKEKCVACGKCVASCPNHLIELVPYKAEHLVQCSPTTRARMLRLSAQPAVSDVPCVQSSVSLMPSIWRTIWLSLTTRSVPTAASAQKNVLSRLLFRRDKISE